MPLVSDGLPVSVCIEVDSGFEGPARYALRQLLIPLNFEPQWVERSRLTQGIYYGTESTRGDEPGIVYLAFDHEAPAYFSSGEAYDAQSALWFESGGGLIPALFGTQGGTPDLVASTFMWLTGWHELVEPTRDEHGRQPYAASLAARLEVALRPPVDDYRAELARKLRSAGIQVQPRKWSGRDWAFCPTHDVDYLRKWRPGILYREFVQNLLANRRGVAFHERRRRALNALRQVRGDDPYRTAIRRMHEEVKKRSGTATYFLKAGGTDPRDVPYALGNRFLQERVAELMASGFEVGLHPSYRTPIDSEMMATELHRLRKAIGTDVKAVRQHYLRFDPMRTPAIHASLGFQVDSTLGFADHEGFRRGTCLPFQLYDLEAGEPLSIWEMPLAAMDSALFNRRGLDVASAVRASKRLSAICRRHGGVFVGLWHNILGDDLEAPGWERHFLLTLDHAAQHGAHISALSQALAGWK